MAGGKTSRRGGYPCSVKSVEKNRRRLSEMLQAMIIGTNIGIGAIFHAETAGNDSQLDKAKPLIQMAGMEIGCHYCIKLQHSETVCFCLTQAVQNQFFTDMQATPLLSHGVTGIGNVSTSAHIVGVKNIKSHKFAGLAISGYGYKSLIGKKCSTGWKRQALLLGKGNPLFYNFKPREQKGILPAQGKKNRQMRRKTGK